MAFVACNPDKEKKEIEKMDFSHEKEDANYKSVCTGKTGFRETARVEYDPEKISLDTICSRTFTSSIRPSEIGYTDESEWVTFENTHEAIDS